MTREQYIQLRRHNDTGNIVYIFYVDLCTQRKVQPLNKTTFSLVFSQWRFAKYYVNIIITKLDSDFNLIEVIENNKIIKIL